MLKPQTSKPTLESECTSMQVSLVQGRSSDAARIFDGSHSRQTEPNTTSACGGHEGLPGRESVSLSEEI